MDAASECLNYGDERIISYKELQGFKDKVTNRKLEDNH
jgi:hypothetical protein